MDEPNPINDIAARHTSAFFRHVGRRYRRRGAGQHARPTSGWQGERGATAVFNTSHLQFPPRVKRVIYLFQAGGPAQQDLFDYKPLLNEQNGEQLPDYVRGGQRLTGMSAKQSSIPLAGSVFKFAQHGQSGAWLSELLPHHRKIVDDVCIVKSMYTEAINHDPAITFFQTGSQIAGRPSMGAWLSYGLGSMNADLPSFIVLVSANKADQPLYSRLWGSGFLDSKFQGVQLRPGKDPVLYLSNPDGICRSGRGAMLDKLNTLNRHQFEQELDPEIESRIAQYEMAFRMQTSVPDVTDLTTESQATFDLYGPDSKTPGTFAANCLLARRLAERGVRFIQLYHQGWDQHGNLPVRLAKTVRRNRSSLGRARARSQTTRHVGRHARRLGRRIRPHFVLARQAHRDRLRPRSSPALLHRLARRRRHQTRHHATAAPTTTATTSPTRHGNPIAPTKDKFTPGAVHVHDLQATILRLLGVDHTQLTFKYQGRHYRLTDVHGNVVNDILA